MVRALTFIYSTAITLWEVRDFAARQNAGAKTFAAATPVADAKAGMAEMSVKYRAGGDLYIPAE